MKSEAFGTVLTDGQYRQYFIGGALIAAGVLFAAFRAQLVSVAITLVGIGLILWGMLLVARKNYASAGVRLAVGATSIILAWVAVRVALILLGVALIAYAIYSVIVTISLFKSSNTTDKARIVTVPVMLALVGSLFVASGAHMLDGLFVGIGVLTIIFGATLFLLRLFASTK